MPERKTNALASLCLLFLLSPLFAPPTARAQVFQGIPAAPGYDQFDVWGVSANGEVVIGTVSNFVLTGDFTGETTASRGFRWENGEMTLLSPLPGHGFSKALGVSEDGSVIVGVSCQAIINDAGCRGVKWTGSAATMLPFMSGDLGDDPTHYAFDVSTDGRIIIGHLSQDDDRGPVRWSSAGPAFATPLSADFENVYPQAASDDGSVIAAAKYWTPKAFKGSYDSEELYRIVGQSAFPLPVPANDIGGVMGISGDGSVIVGAVRARDDNAPYPVQWGPNGYEELALPDSAIAGEALDASQDGSVVVGMYYTEMLQRRTAIWRDGVFSDLQWELEEAGVDLGEAGIAESYAISADGTVVVGRERGSPDFRGFRLKIPLRLVVNDTGDQPDADAGDGKCDADPADEGMQCTIRAAIQEANARTNDHVTVTFDLPASQMANGTYWIGVTSPLDAITRPLSIDATTQPGFVEGTPLVVLGRQASLQAGPNYSLRLQTDDSVIRGLHFFGHEDAGILITGNDNRIEKNFFEANEIGLIVQSGSRNTIGVCPEEDETISTGNAFFENTVGILLSEGASENEINCNLVSAHPFPDRRLDQMEAGIQIKDSPSNRVIGNTVDFQRSFGIYMLGEEASENHLEGNLLGKDGLNSWGIVVNGGSRNQIGGDEKPNIVFQSGIGGVLVLSDQTGVTAEANVLHNLWIGTNEDGEVEAGDSRGLLGITIGEGALDTEIGKPIAGGGYSIIVGNQQDRNISLFTPLAIGTRINSALVGFGKEVSGGSGFAASFPAGYGIHVEGAVGTEIGSWTGDFDTNPSVQLGRHNDRGIYVTGETEHRITLNGLVETSDFTPVNTQTKIRGVRMIHSGLSCSGPARTCDVTAGGIMIYEGTGVEIGPQVSMHVPGSGITLVAAEDVQITGTTIVEDLRGFGTDDAGIRVRSSSGVQIGSAGSINLFGTDTSLGNRISGYGIGIILVGDQGGAKPINTDDVTIQATVFERGERSAAQGILIHQNVNNTTIGGAGEGERNLFENLDASIQLLGGRPNFTAEKPPANTIITGNVFGGEDASTENGGTAIEVVRAVDTHIGGALTGGNVIRNQQRAVVLHRPIDDRPGTVIVGNSIYGNDSNGIIGWSSTGDFAQDPLRLPHPAVLGTVTDGGTVTAAGVVIGRPERTMRIDFYRSDVCRSVDEGKTFLFSQSATTSALGAAFFEAEVPVAVGNGLTITATDLDARRTSEFSLCFSHQGEKGTVELLVESVGELVSGVDGLLARVASAGKTAETHKLFVTAYDQVPVAQRFAGESAASPSQEEILPVAAIGRYWRVETDAATASPRLDLCLDVSALSEEEAGATVVIQRNASSGGLWIPTDTHLETHDGIRYACASGVVPSGDFGLGSGTPAVLASATLLEPANDAVDVEAPATMTWQALAEAAHYDFQIALDPAFDALLVDTSGVTGTSLHVDSLNAGALLYWRVRGATASGEVGPWSAPFRFATRAISLAAEEETTVPDGFTLDQNYPNPFNPQTTIAFGVRHAGHVRLAVYDLLGREVARLVDESLSAGRHEVTFNAAGLPTGLYVYRIEAGRHTQSRRMVLVK